MDWYYVQNGKRRGPVSDEELRMLADTGVVGAEGLVWRKGMSNWRRYGDIQAEAGFGGVVQTQLMTGRQLHNCVECGRIFPAEEMVQYGESRICAECKPIFFQRLKEGAPLPATFKYAGFWIRVAAKFIDWFIVGIVNGALRFGFAFFMINPEPGKPPKPAFFVLWLVSSLIQFAISVSYSTYFVGKFAATPGKMVCGLKIITSDGGKVSYARALARYFGEILSGLILGIGYLMVAFDEQKRGLHDRICDTRVIWK